ncbi:heteroproteinous nuclear ribonucleoprotein [Sparganum proliferum]
MCTLLVEKTPDTDVNPKGIFVTYLSETTEDCDLHEYFSKFGIITEVIVLKGKRSGDPHRKGFVTFRDTDSVKMVFDAVPHLLNGKHIGVFPAWNRKSGQFVPQTHTSVSDESASASAFNKTIFVCRLKPTTTATDLETYFSKFGSVSRAKVATHLDSSQCRGFGYVEFSDRKAFEGGVLEACHFLNGSRLKVEPYERRTSSNSDSTHT